MTTLKTKTLYFKDRKVVISQGDDGFWRDEYGTLYALSNSSDSTDPDVRLGVGIFSLDKSNPLTPAAIAHDYAYTSPVYQAFHNRSEADELLKKQLEQLAGNSLIKYMAMPLYLLARIFGKIFWENKKTND